MDQNLHNDIGDQFRDGIEPLSETPRKLVWESIEQQLDKNDAEKYKLRYVSFRKMAAVLLFLLLSIATFTVIYITQKNGKGKNNNNIATNKDADLKNQEPLNKNTQQQKNEIRPVDTLLITDKNDNEKMMADSFMKTEDISIGNKEKRNNPITSRDNIREKKDALSLAGKNALKNENSITRNIVRKTPVLNKSNNRKGKLVNEYNSEEDLAIKDQVVPLLQKSTEPMVIQTISVEYDVAHIKMPVVLFPAIVIKDTLTRLAENPAQKSNKKADAFYPRFSVTAYAAPEIAGYVLEDDETNQYANKQIIEKRERQDLSISTGILIGYKLNNRLTLQSGITYSSTKISIDASKIYAEATNVGDVKYRYNTSSGYSYILPPFNMSPSIGDSLLTRISEHILQSVVIPVMAKYRFGNKKFSFSAGAGVAFNFLTKATLGTELVNSQNQEVEIFTKLEGLKKVSYSILIAPELQYQVSQKWAFNAMPYFKYALAPINKGNIVTTYPYNIGLGIGVVYKF